MLQCGRIWREIDRDVSFMKETEQFISNRLGITFYQLVASKLTQENSHSSLIVSDKAFLLYNLRCMYSSIETSKTSFESLESKAFTIKNVVLYHERVLDNFQYCTFLFEFFISSPGTFLQVKKCVFMCRVRILPYISHTPSTFQNAHVKDWLEGHTICHTGRERLIRTRLIRSST